MEVSNSDGRVLGSVSVDRISCQFQIEHSDDQHNTKRLLITWDGVLTMATYQHGLRPLMSHFGITVTTTMVMVLANRQIKKSMEPLQIPELGLCNLNFCQHSA